SLPRPFLGQDLGVQLVNFVFGLQHVSSAAFLHTIARTVCILLDLRLHCHHFFVGLAQRVHIHRALRIRNLSVESFFACSPPRSRIKCDPRDRGDKENRSRFFHPCLLLTHVRSGRNAQAKSG